MTDLPSGTVTFLFTDIEGSTRLLRALGRERYAQALADQERLLRTAFSRSGGREIDTQGDSFFVAFPSAAEAVSAAEAAQRALAGHSWPEGREVRVRMGMHTGEPVVGEARYIGLGVHRAARICSVGHGGQVLLSHMTHDLLDDEELSEISFKDLGERRLKDLDRPERIYQLVMDGLPADFPPLKTVDAQPEEATPFAGREQELAEAAQQRSNPHAARGGATFSWRVGRRACGCGRYSGLRAQPRQLERACYSLRSFIGRPQFGGRRQSGDKPSDRGRACRREPRPLGR